MKKFDYQFKKCIRIYKRLSIILGFWVEELGLLLYIGFPDNEVELLRGAAVKLDVLDKCQFIGEIGSLNNVGKLIDVESIYSKFPSVVFLNLDARAEHWKKSLIDFKAHKMLRVVPVVGLGRVNKKEVQQLYDMRINSYIEKPSTFAEMVRVAGVTLKFWLETSQVPNILISDI